MTSTAGFVPPADPPTPTADDDTIQRAAEFIEKHCGRSWRWEAAQLAQAMHDAGLLRSPLGRAVTQAERDVIDTASAVAESLRVAHLHMDGCLCVGCEDRRTFLAAVDRLAAPGPKEATQAVTQAERDVINTATTETEAELYGIDGTAGSHSGLDAARVARRAAVTRLQTARHTGGD